MADNVKHWPSWANWYARDEEGHFSYFEKEPKIEKSLVKTKIWLTNTGEQLVVPPQMEISEIDPDTHWTESKQRRPEQ